MDKYTPPRKPHIPKDLPLVLKDLTREILRAQPADVYAFAVAHFSQRLAERGTAQAKDSVPSEQQDPAPQPEHPMQPVVNVADERPQSDDPNSEEDMKLAAVVSRLGARHPVTEDAYCCIEDVAQRAANANAAAAASLAASAPSPDGPAPLPPPPATGLPAGVRFYAVCDGHGGTATSSFAAANLWQRVAASPAFAAGEFGKALEDGFRETEAALEPHLVAVDGMSSGACCVCALVAGKRVWVGNLGDSRCVLARAGGAEPMSVDHKVTEKGEVARLSAAGAFVHMNRLLGVLAVSRSLGDFEIKKAARDATDPTRSVLIATPDIREHEVAEGDRFLVLASDGVWDALSSEAAAELVVATTDETHSVKRAAEKLVDTAAKTSDDDITAIIVPLV